MESRVINYIHGLSPCNGANLLKSYQMSLFKKKEGAKTPLNVSLLRKVRKGIYAVRTTAYGIEMYRIVSELEPTKGFVLFVHNKSVLISVLREMRIEAAIAASKRTMKSDQKAKRLSY